MSAYDLPSDQECLDRAFEIDAPTNDRLVNRALAACHLENSKRYCRAIGKAPNYVNPFALSEKMQCRKLFDRNPLLTVFCDKLEARAYALQADSRLKAAEFLWLSTDPETIPFDTLPTPFIVKPSNASGAKLVVRHSEEIDTEKFRARCKSWLGKTYGESQGEWGYRDVKRKILVERFLEPPEGSPYPESYRLFAFSGRVELLAHDWMVGDWDSYTTYFDRNWKRLPINCWEGWRTAGQHLPALPKVKRPRPLAAMISSAENLAREIDYVRVDYYVIGEDIYFGELTAYDESGFAYLFEENAEYGDFPPRDLDFELGRRWAFRNPPVDVKLEMAAAAAPGTEAAREALELRMRLEIEREAETRLDNALAIDPNLPKAQRQEHAGRRPRLA